MKNKIFNAQEVQAIILGDKTQFREVIKKPLKHFDHIRINQDERVSAYNKTTGWYEELKNIKPPYKIGQKIFCKESFWQFGSYDGGYDGDEARFIGINKITFCPEEAASEQTLRRGWIKRPAQYMKQEHSRLTLQIKEIRVECLQSISEEDAIQEGVRPYKSGYEIGNQSALFPKTAFFAYWNATHKKPEEKFEANPLSVSNPWVWVIDFEMVK
jgi:hypothetical protein